MRRVTVLAAVLALMAPAEAQEATADLLRSHLYAGELAEGRAAMEARAAEDAEAAFGLGVFAVFEAIEETAQALYRHGFNPERGIAVGPFFGMPRAEAGGPAPEELTYDLLRGYLEAFVVGLDTAQPLLMAASQGEFAVEIDVMQIRADIDGDGVAGAHESIGAFLALAAQMGERLDMGSGLAPDLAMPVHVFAFDRGDALWLAGYTQVLAATVDFLLAHDFETFFDAGLHRIFPGAGLPMDSQPSTGMIFMERDSDALLADAIAMVHTISWPVIDRDKLAGARDRALAMMDLSRQSWAAILTETDDHLEFIPAPHQTSPFETLEVSKETVEAWLETLDVSQRILEGDLLLPHWRYPHLGFDLGAWFAEAERTDLVLLFTGLDALSFLKQGEIASAESFAAANAVFGRSIWNYALWFN